MSWARRFLAFKLNPTLGLLLAFFASLLAGLILLLIVGLVFQKQRLESWLNSFVLHSVEGSLPEGFYVESLELGWTLKSVLLSRQVHLWMGLKTPYGLLHSQGPIKATRLKGSRDWDVEFQPDFKWRSDKSEGQELRLEGLLKVIYSPELKRLQYADFSIQSRGSGDQGRQDLRWEDFYLSGLELKLSLLLSEPKDESGSLLEDVKVDLSLAWQDAGARFGSHRAKMGKGKLLAHLEGCELRLKVPELPFQVQALEEGTGEGRSSWTLNWPKACSLKPDLELQGQFYDLMFESLAGDRAVALAGLTTQWSLQDAGSDTLQVAGTILPEELELLWGDIYASPPVEAYKLHTEWDFVQREGLRLSELKLSLEAKAEGREPLMNLTLRAQQAAADQGLWPEELLGHWIWNSTLQEIFELMPSFSLGDWQVAASIRAQLKFIWSQEAFRWLHPSFMEVGEIELSNSGLRHLSEKGQIQLKTLSGQSAPSEEMSLLGRIHWPRLRQHNLKGALGPWTFPIQVDFRAQQIRLSPVDMPLTMDSLPLELSPLKGSVSWGGALSYEFSTGLRLKDLDLQQLSHLLCMDSELTPQAVLSLDYPEIHLSQNRLMAPGQGRLELFSGEAKVSEVSVENLFSANPTTRMSVHWNDLDLSAIGAFTNFGGMVGRLSGHLKDLAFRGTLVTNYDFNFRLLPLSGRSRLYFSRQATENVVDIFARGQGVSEGPVGTLLRWSGRIFGDYGILYAGVQARTHGQFVILETFDTPEVLAREQSRFLLYGQRIKMPLSTKTYPLILSQSGWAGFLTYFKESVFQIMGREDKGTETVQDCFAP